MTARSQPSLIFINVARLPSRIANASMIIDFPDPVSPEKILKPEANSKDKFSTKTKFEISKFLNIWRYCYGGLLPIRPGFIFQRSFFLNSEK